MTILVVGATGATGRLLVTQLLDRGQNVRVVVRSPDSLPESVRRDERLTMIRASVLDLSDEDMARHVKGCTAVASCLGHSLNLKGIYGQPRRLVTDATARLCEAIKSNESDTVTKFVLMNTAGNSNRDLQEPISSAQKCVTGLLRLCLPPHVDNERAADFLRMSIGQNDKMIAWAVVRPDTLIDQDWVTEYKEVLFQTRDMGWGDDIYLYTTLRELREQLPLRLVEGKPRVLKQYRGNGGNGVWKVEAHPNGRALVRVRHALRGSVEEELSLEEFLARCEGYFAGPGRIIDQPYQERLTEGMIRCYLVRDRVVGFGHQLINALFPPPPGAPPSEAPTPGPRLYYPPTRPDFQPLKARLEEQWLPAMQQVLGIDVQALPVIWDADFLYGPKTASGEDTYVLCEINVSSVHPFPDEALEPLARETAKRLRS